MVHLANDFRNHRTLTQARLEAAMHQRELLLRESEDLIEDFAAWRERFAGLDETGLARARPLLERLEQIPARWADSLHGYLARCLPRIATADTALSPEDHAQVLACLDAWQQAQEQALRTQLENLGAAVHETKQTHIAGSERLAERLDAMEHQLLLLGRPARAQLSDAN
ncbi:MAG: hypothetical protein ACOCYN_00350 [Planctomycetota bacterium]